jgi:hypothetical protein
MPDWGWWIAGGCGAAVLGLYLMRRPLRRIAEEIQFERAREMYDLQRDHLAERFFEAASTTGKPRGLRWKDCELGGAAVFARDRASRELQALLSVTIAFEAIEDSEMEDVQAVSNLRNATAVFHFRQGQWRASGRALFNMNPDEALEHFKSQLEAAPARE